MVTRGLEVVRFRGRYYTRFYQYDIYLEELGAKMVADIPTTPEKYQTWLESMRAEYAAKERLIEERVYEMRDDCEPDYRQFREFEVLPSEIPRLDQLDAEYVYTINLDHEVFTVNHSIHYELGNIPRQDSLWLRAVEESVFRYKPAMSLDVCPEEYMASLALELPEYAREMDHEFDVVVPKTDMAEPRKAFLTHVLAGVLIEYKDEIIRFGRDWSPESFPFRELAFALVSIASGQARFHSFPAQSCNPRTCIWFGCNSNHIHKSPGWLGKRWAGDSAPLLEFGSLSHRPGELPGASPAATMYWHEGVLVSLALVVDGAAVTKAANWGIEQGRVKFRVVVLSLFEACLAEVLFVAGDEEPVIRCTRPYNLSPLRAEYCVSTHPRERSELKDGMELQRQRAQLLMQSNCAGTGRRLRSMFPGLAALVNFFEVAVSLGAASKSEGIFPPEVYDRILDFADYDTWKACSVVSPAIRFSCLGKYRLDDRMRIVAGPFVRLEERRKDPLLSFDFEDMHKGETLPMMWVPRHTKTEECNWMPVVGSDRRVLMVDVAVEYEPAGDVPVEADSNGGR
ncbi:hypothetical protein AK830_g11107 [Neonectria ditissima]|uniref:Uncharacterized protein n=1 Tax=Neonectria ditissima TaxID=78410 RepID=A0A0P7B8Y7_9HYPO|nr:hypothetical protein AK830_g11107 [Neonectria ditissima]